MTRHLRTLSLASFRCTSHLCASHLCASLLIASAVLAFCSGSAVAQTPQTVGAAQPAPIDSVMIFTPIKPLIETEDIANGSQSSSLLGLSGSFSDYGPAGGILYQYRFGGDFSMGLTLDFSTAKGSREFGFQDEVKVNRIFLLPMMLNGEYRLFSTTMSEGFRPYVTLGAGATLLITNPAYESFFAALSQNTYEYIPSGFVGAGAHFGTDRHSQWGASARYFFIPHSTPIQSTNFQSLTDLSGLFLSISYQFGL